MIAADTSAWIDFGKGVDSAHARRLETALEQGAVVMPEPVLFELLSSPELPTAAERHLRALPRLASKEGAWERAAALRRSLLKRGLRARSMDCLIAQSCIDHGVALITADGDFRHFTARGLKRA